jgi:hypothetical protein
MRVGVVGSQIQYEQDAVQCELGLALFAVKSAASQTASSAALAIDPSIRPFGFVRSGQAFQACGKSVFTFSGSLLRLFLCAPAESGVKIASN